MAGNDQPQLDSEKIQLTAANARVALLEDNLALLNQRLLSLEAAKAEALAREAINRATAERARQQLAFLVECSALLASSLDYETTLSNLARMAVPTLGDSCVLHVIDPDGTIRYVEQVHVIPTKQELVRRLRSRHPLTWETHHPLVAVLRTGQSIHFDNASEVIREHVEDDPQGRAIIEMLGFRECLIVPLTLHGQVRGALSLIISESERHYGPDDIVFAEELARRGVQAMENARSYAQVQAMLHQKDELLDEIRRTQAQFLQAQRLESIGRLAAGIAHDFNNLLTAITGYVSIVIESLGPGDANLDDLRQVQEAANRASALTRQLLAFARKQTIASSPVSLNDLVSNLEKLLRRLISEDIQLVIQLAEPPWTVLADPGQIEQVLVNLVVNACDAMPEGGLLTIETAHKDLDAQAAQAYGNLEPGRYVQLSVQDTGIGMAPEVQQHAFDPFFTTKAQGAGTGLGLATCYGIVKQHGGAIVLSSIEGQGTVVTLVLPAVDQPAAPKEPDDQDELPRGTETVLLVEDEDAVRAMVARVLHAQGYNVLVAPNGLEALRLLDDDGVAPIQILVSDVKMPHMTGPALAEQMRARLPHLKILFMSGYTDSLFTGRERLAQSSALILKPFATATLIRKVREVLDS